MPFLVPLYQRFWRLVGHAEIHVSFRNWSLLQDAGAAG